MNIKRVLRKYHIQQKELAKEMGISPITLCNSIAKGDNINLSSLRRIASTVGCSITEFFEDEINAPLNPKQKGKTYHGLTCPCCGAQLALNLSEETAELEE